jgi:hypothetical protein
MFIRTQFPSTILMLAILIVMGCFSKFSKIASGDPYSWARNQDSVVKNDTLTFVWHPADSMQGKYNYIILAGYQGRSLIIDKNRSFREYGWGDVRTPIKPKTTKGKWTFENGNLALRYGCKTMNLKVHRYAWATFLVPESKTAAFAYAFHRNKGKIDSLSPHIRQLKGSAINEQLSEFRTLCYIRHGNP